MRELKFRAWDGAKMTQQFHITGMGIAWQSTDNLEEGYSESIDFTIMQFTGLKDKNMPVNNCLYEGDIVSLDGILIGNIYQNGEILKGNSHIVIEGFGTKNWRTTEQRALDVGCSYSK